MQHRGAVTAALTLTGAVVHRKWKAAVSFQEYQKNKKTVPSLCGPKAPTALSLSATLVAIVLCLSLRSFSNLFHCCSFRPVGINYNCPSPTTDHDKSSGGATQKTRRSKESQSQTPQHPEGAPHTVLCSLLKPCRRLGLLTLGRMPHPPHEPSVAGLMLPSPPALPAHFYLQLPAAPFARLHRGMNLCLAQLSRGTFPKLQQVYPKSFKLLFIGHGLYRIWALYRTEPCCPNNLLEYLDTARNRILEEIHYDWPANSSCAPRWS